ncbi:MAG: ABC transporter permease subunit [Paracoccus sp. (in: a-proteobacteria)]|uniref:ABC transporter permease subunit n=1 Tax=Paracoccus sp. TaxID=267 RepID=UPI003241CEB5
MTRPLLITLAIAGMVLAVPLAVGYPACSRLACWHVFGFTYVIRGTPLLVQLFILYCGLPQFGVIRNSAL